MLTDARLRAPRWRKLGISSHRDQADLETAMDAYARRLAQQREDEIVPSEADIESARLSPRVEAAGIEPASADAPV